jgi:hypothetical protein
MSALILHKAFRNKHAGASSVKHALAQSLPAAAAVSPRRRRLSAHAIDADIVAGNRFAASRFERACAWRN